MRTIRALFIAPSTSAARRKQRAPRRERAIAITARSGARQQNRCRRGRIAGNYTRLRSRRSIDSIALAYLGVVRARAPFRNWADMSPAPDVNVGNDTWRPSYTFRRASRREVMYIDIAVCVYRFLFLGFRGRVEPCSLPLPGVAGKNEGNRSPFEKSAVKARNTREAVRKAAPVQPSRINVPQI